MIKRSKTSSSIFFLIIVLAAVFYFIENKPVKNFINGSVNFIMPERQSLEESQKALALLTEIKNLKKENSDLEKFINKKGVKKEILAKVKLGGGYIFSDFLLIDSGSEAGIKIGDTVVTNGNFVIGKISEIGDYWSNVTPFSKAGEKIVLKTGGGGALLFDGTGIGMGEIYSKLPNTSGIKVGEGVWWGEDQSYLVGLVDNVNNSENSDINGVTIKNPYALKNLTNVIVVTRE